MTYYDRAGVPMDDVMSWAESFDHANRRVGFTTVTGGNPPRTYEISTVHLGLDHGWGDGPPIIFETMVFGLDDDDEMMDRYSTEAQAREGHTAMVVQVSAMVSNPVVLDVDPADASTKRPT